MVKYSSRILLRTKPKEMKRLFWIFIFVILGIAQSSYAQGILSSLEFLQYNPDAKSAGMGNTYLGNGRGMYLYGDPSVFGRNEDRLFASYSLAVLPKNALGRTLYNSFSAGYKFQPNWSIMAGFRMQTNPSIPIIDNSGFELGKVKPNDWSIDFGSSVGLSEHWQSFVLGSFIHSYQGLNASGVAFSLGANYANDFSLSQLPIQYSCTLALSNFGWGLKYGKDKKKVELPFAAELGGKLDVPFFANHKVSIAGIMGYELRTSITNRLFGGVGLEYEFMKFASLRAGYHHRNYMNSFTFGIGGHYKFIALDLAYIMTQKNEFNQFRVGMSFGF